LPGGLETGVWWYGWRGSIATIQPKNLAFMRLSAGAVGLSVAVDVALLVALVVTQPVQPPEFRGKFP
jgi:hypothetical protein